MGRREVIGSICGIVGTMIGIVSFLLVVMHQDWLTYESPDHGIRIEYPSDWTKQEKVQTDNNILTLTDLKSGSGATFDINIEDFDPSHSSLPKYVDDQIDNLKERREDFKLLRESHTQLNENVPAYKVVYTNTKKADGMQFENMRIWTMKNDKVYIIRYSAPQSLYSVSYVKVDKMINSFAFTK